MISLVCVYGSSTLAVDHFDGPKPAKYSLYCDTVDGGGEALIFFQSETGRE